MDVVVHLYDFSAAAIKCRDGKCTRTQTAIVRVIVLVCILKSTRILLSSRVADPRSAHRFELVLIVRIFSIHLHDNTTDGRSHRCIARTVSLRTGK